MSEADERIRYHALKNYSEHMKRFKHTLDDNERRFLVSGFASGWDTHRSDVYDRYVKLRELLQRRGYTDIEIREIIEGD